MSDPVSSGASPEIKRTSRRLSAKQVEEVTRRVMAGENGAALAREFGMSRAYVSLLKRKQEEPEKFGRRRATSKRIVMTAAEEAKVEAAMSEGPPEAHGMTWHLFWSKDAIRELARKVLGLEISVASAKRLSRRRPPEPAESWDPKPRPPRPADIRNLDPQMAADAEFVAYYLSPQAQRLAEREYELALAHWEQREAERIKKRGPAPQVPGNPYVAGHPDAAALAEAERMWSEGMATKKWRMPPDMPAGLATPPPPGERTGKHAKSKGSPFTPSKKKKRKKR